MAWPGLSASFKYAYKNQALKQGLLREMEGYHFKYTYTGIKTPFGQHLIFCASKHASTGIGTKLAWDQREEHSQHAYKHQALKQPRTWMNEFMRFKYALTSGIKIR